MKLSVMKLSLRHGLYDMYRFIPGTRSLVKKIWTPAFLNCLPRSWHNWKKLIPLVVFSVNSSVDLFIFRKKRTAKSSAIVRYFLFEFADSVPKSKHESSTTSELSGINEQINIAEIEIRVFFD